MRMLCPLCLTRRHISVLMENRGTGQWVCPGCEAEILAGDEDMPPEPDDGALYSGAPPRIKKRRGNRKSGRRPTMRRKPEPWYRKWGYE